MTEDEQGKGGLSIPVMLVLIVALLLGVNWIFSLIGTIAPPAQDEVVWERLLTTSGQSGGYDMRLLQEQQRQESDVEAWLDSAKDWSKRGDGSAQDTSVFWLYRQDTDEYILYLPTHDRAITAQSITATEEKDADGEVSLVLRLRTPENSAQVVPEEQLVCLRVDVGAWKGIRVQVILDGREREVQKLTSKGDTLYSLEEVYIGRDRLVP